MAEQRDGQGVGHSGRRHAIQHAQGPGLRREPSVGAGRQHVAPTPGREGRILQDGQAQEERGRAPAGGRGPTPQTGGARSRQQRGHEADHHAEPRIGPEHRRHLVQQRGGAHEREGPDPPLGRERAEEGGHGDARQDGSAAARKRGPVPAQPEPQRHGPQDEERPAHAHLLLQERPLEAAPGPELPHPGPGQRVVHRGDEIAPPSRTVEEEVGAGEGEGSRTKQDRGGHAVDEEEAGRGRRREREARERQASPPAFAPAGAARRPRRRRAPPGSGRRR